MGNINMACLWWVAFMRLEGYFYRFTCRCCRLKVVTELVATSNGIPS